MSDEFTLELFGIDESPDDEPVDDGQASELSEEELEQRLQTATEEEINAYNDDGIIPPARESANASLATEPVDAPPAKAKKERKPKEPKAPKTVDYFRLPGGQKLRDELVKNSKTEQDAIEEIQSNQLENVEGYIPFSHLFGMFLEAGMDIKWAQFLKVVGGHRALLSPVHPSLRVHWFGKRRFFAPEAYSEEVMEAVQLALVKEPKEAKPKAKKERKVKAEDQPQKAQDGPTSWDDLSKATIISFLNQVRPDATVNKGMSKAQLLTILEENGLTPADYFANS